jgi:hypothetical protein
MDKVATARINNLRISEANFVPTSEQSITVSLSDLRQIITDAVQDALQPLQDEVMELKATVASQGEKIRSLEATQEQDTTRICLDIAYDRRRLAALEKAEEEPTATESERIDRIEKLCTDAPKHEISLSELRGRLGIDKAVLSRLLKKIDRDTFYLRKSTLDKRVRYLCCRHEIGGR